MTAFNIAADTLFGNSDLGKDATWKPGGIGGFAVRVIVTAPDKLVDFGRSRAALPSVLIDVRKTDVSAPGETDAVVIDAVEYKITAPPMLDELGIVWRCEAERA